MDKTDRIWYNTVMNAITYAGAFDGARREQFNNKFEVLVAGGRGEIAAGEIKCGISAGEIAVVPPLTRYRASFNGMKVTLEQALLPIKTVKILKDGDGGIAYAARRACEYYEKERTAPILEALGGLIVAYINYFSAGEFSPVVGVVREDVDKNLSNPTYSLEDAIKKLPLSYDYVRKLFKKETGLTPHEYLTERRMGLARELIDSNMTNQFSNYSVSQIAEACGFSEPLYFSRVFKKYYGKSPSAFAAERKK